MQTLGELEIEGVVRNVKPVSSTPFRTKLAWLRKGFLAVLDQGLLSGSNFFLSVLLARWLTREEYGSYTLAFSIFILLAGIHSAFILEPMCVFGPEAYATRCGRYVRKLLGFHGVFSAFLALLAMAGAFLLPFFITDRGLDSAMWGVCVAAPLVLSYWLLRRAAYLKFAPGVAAGGSAAYCVGVLLLVVLFRNRMSPFMGFLVQALAAIPAAWVLLGSLRKADEVNAPVINREVLQQHWRYGRWVLGSAIVTWISGYAYYLIVGAILPMPDVAALRALRNLTEPCYRAMAAIILLVLPWASARLAQEGVEGLRRRTRNLNLMFGGVALTYLVVLSIFGKQIMGLLYAGRYNGSANLLMLATAPLVFIAASLGSEIAVQVMQAPSEVFLAYGASGVVTLVLGIAFTRYWGLTGGLVSILISSITVLVVLSYRCQKRLRAAASVATHRPNKLAEDLNLG